MGGLTGPPTGGVVGVPTGAKYGVKILTKSATLSFIQSYTCWQKFPPPPDPGVPPPGFPPLGPVSGGLLLPLKKLMTLLSPLIALISNLIGLNSLPPIHIPTNHFQLSAKNFRTFTKFSLFFSSDNHFQALLMRMPVPNIVANSRSLSKIFFAGATTLLN